MNKEIKQLFQKINCDDILNKKFYSVWFFTNERINYFFPEMEKKKEIKKVFSVGGGGDLAFSLLSAQSLKIYQLDVCDIRQMACVSIDFKIGLLKNKVQRIFKFVFRQTSFHKEQTYKRIEETITPLSRKIIKLVIKDYGKNDLLKYLKKSGLWHRDSFWQIKNKKEYLPYLAEEKNYQLLRSNLDKITIYLGDFNVKPEIDFG